MRSLTLLILVFLFACKHETKPEDFVGTYYIIKPQKISESNILAPKKKGFLLSSYPSIKYYDASPVTFELFMTNGALDGKMTYTEFGDLALNSFGETASTIKSYPLGLSRFRLTGDTLKFEIEVPDLFTQTSYTAAVVRGEINIQVGISNEPLPDDESMVAALGNYTGIDDGLYFFRTVSKAEGDSIRISYLKSQIDAWLAKGEDEESYEIKFLRNRIEKLSGKVQQ